MELADLAINTSAAVIQTSQVAAFPEFFNQLVRLENHQLRHYPIVLNAEQKTITIDQVREVRSEVVFSLGDSEQKDIIFLWADLLTVPAQQALLKLLEEPPPRTRLWLVTTKPQALLETIRSRCITCCQTNATETSSQQALLPKALRAISLETLGSESYTELIRYAAIPKDRSEAVAWCQSLLLDYHALLPTSYQQQMLLLQAMEQLQQNANVKLVLEHFLFEVKAAVSAQTN